MDRKAFIGILVVVCIATGCARKGIRVGSKNFTEQVVLGEIIALHLEQKLNQRVSRQLNLGGTLLAHQALVSGEIDLYPEYTGTAYASVLKHSGVQDAAAVLANVRAEYAKLQVRWMDPFGFNNSFAMVVRGEDARKLRTTTLSEAAASMKWQLGVGYEFVSRSDGLKALKQTYSNLQLSGSPKTMDLGLLYQALEQKQVGMAAGNTTDGILSARDFVVLEDDRRAFGPYQACVAVREASLREYPQLEQSLQELSGRISSDAMRRLNYEVDGKHRRPAEVAAEFLQSIH